jgi:hypothetical protein
MSAPQDTPPNIPYGAWPRRRRWPLVLLIAVFVVSFGVLLWLSLVYPARPG